MATIKNFRRKYFSKISPSDLEILISHTIKKPMEFILAHPEYELTPYQVLCIRYYVWQRSKKKPIAYIVGRKEFYGLEFKVNKDVLIPRPETEQIVELVTCNLKLKKEKEKKNIIIFDIGTGSGNIIISVAKNILSCELQVASYKLYASDISEKALRIAKQNAKIHKVDKKIKFLQGDLLKPLVKIIKNEEGLEIGNCLPAGEAGKLEILIIANLPYLSKKIYDSASADVKKYEPKSALYGSDEGLEHYKKLLQQIKKLRKVTSYKLQVTSFLEFSPEQKNKLTKLIKNHFPQAKVKFRKDLAGKWRVCRIEIS